MWWRIPRSQFERQKGEGNRRALAEIAAGGEVPGLLVYRAGTESQPPVGWVSLGPRESFPVLERSRILKRVDDQPVWSVVCFFISRPYRRQGLTAALLKLAVDYARQQGAKILEGYPIEPKKPDVPAPFAFTGLVSAFRSAGFVEVARRSETRPIMRYILDE